MTNITINTQEVHIHADVPSITGTAVTLGESEPLLKDFTTTLKPYTPTKGEQALEEYFDLVRQQFKVLVEEALVKNSETTFADSDGDSAAYTLRNNLEEIEKNPDQLGRISDSNFNTIKAAANMAIFAALFLYEKRVIAVGE